MRSRPDYVVREHIIELLRAGGFARRFRGFSLNHRAVAARGDDGEQAFRGRFRPGHRQGNLASLHGRTVWTLPRAILNEVLDKALALIEPDEEEP